MSTCGYMQETSDIASVMDGDLEPFVQAWLRHRAATEGAAAASDVAAEPAA